MCVVSPVVHTSKISSCQKNVFSFLVAVNNSIKVGPLVFLVISVCNHGEHYETSGIVLRNFSLGHGRRHCSKGNSPWYTLDRRQGGFRFLSGRSGEARNFLQLPVIEKRFLDNPTYKMFRLSEYE